MLLLIEVLSKIFWKFISTEYFFAKVLNTTSSTWLDSCSFESDGFTLCVDSFFPFESPFTYLKQTLVNTYIMIENIFYYHERWSGKKY